jgi:hypothetical protein
MPSGASVIINGRTKARVDDAVRQMRATFPDASISGVAADLSTPEGVSDFVAQVPHAALDAWLPDRFKDRFLVSTGKPVFHPKAIIWRDANDRCHSVVG